MTYALGRRPSVPDARNWRLEGAGLNLVRPKAVSDPALDAALAAFMGKRYGKEAKALATLLVQRVEALQPVTPAPPVPPTPAPPAPAPIPVAAPMQWALGAPGVLDQGNTPHCVGFTGADWENLAPFQDNVPNAEGDAIYYACKVLDGEPQQEDGSSIHSLARAMQAKGRIAAYAWLADLAAVKTYVREHGPVPIGIDWLKDMFNPDAAGLVHPTGGVAGGHAITIAGDDPEPDQAILLNHWGTGWGPLGGWFRMQWAELGELLFNSNGEALAAIEIS